MGGGSARARAAPQHLPRAPAPVRPAAPPCPDTARLLLHLAGGHQLGGGSAGRRRLGALGRSHMGRAQRTGGRAPCAARGCAQVERGGGSQARRGGGQRRRSRHCRSRHFPGWLCCGLGGAGGVSKQGWVPGRRCTFLGPLASRPKPWAAGPNCSPQRPVQRHGPPAGSSRARACKLHRPMSKGRSPGAQPPPVAGARRLAHHPPWLLQPLVPVAGRAWHAQLRSGGQAQQRAEATATGFRLACVRQGRAARRCPPQLPPHSRPAATHAGDLGCKHAQHSSFHVCTAKACKLRLQHWARHEAAAWAAVGWRPACAARLPPCKRRPQASRPSLQRWPEVTWHIGQREGHEIRALGRLQRRLLLHVHAASCHHHAAAAAAHSNPPPSPLIARLCAAPSRCRT